MRALLQRVRFARVRVDGVEIAAVGQGLLIFLGVAVGDAPGVETRLAERCAELRIFEDKEGRMNCSVVELQAEAIVVPQFTLCADVSRGRRPGFDGAAPPAVAERSFSSFCEQLGALGVRTQRGRFGASMDVELVNAGPATFLLESPKG